MTRKQRRLTMIGGSLTVLAIAAALVLNAMRDSIVFFSTPTIAARADPARQAVRLGGLVRRAHWYRRQSGVNCSVADGAPTVPVPTRGFCRTCSVKGRRRHRRRAGCLRRLQGRYVWPA